VNTEISVDFARPDTHDQLESSVRGVLERFGPEYWRHKDQTHEFPHEFAVDAGKAGLMGTMLPEEYGGIGLGVAEASLVLRTIADSNAGLDGCSVVHNGMFGLNPLLKHGTEEQKRRYLPRAAGGKLDSCFIVTEPDAGVDTTQIKTFARHEGDSWTIRGRKVWISRAQEAEMGLLLCRTTPADQVAKRTEGMTLFFIPMDSPQVQIREIPKMGRHAVDSNEVVIDDLMVPNSAVVGEVGRGFHNILDGLNPERIMVAAEAIGLGYQVVRRAARYARERIVFGRPIGQNQGVQLPLADAWSKLKAADLAMQEAAWRYDNGLSCGAEANMAKLRATEAAHEAVNVAFESFGGYSYAQEYDIERFYRQLPLTRVAPVTNNLTKAFIATHVLDLPKSY
jgi:acyl-CoA dehydrogenase